MILTHLAVAAMAFSEAPASRPVDIEDLHPFTLQSTIETHGLAVKAWRVGSPWREEHGDTDYVICLDGGELAIEDRETGRVVQARTAPANTTWHWLGRDERCCYLNASPAEEGNRQGHTTPTVERLELASLTWLTPIAIEFEQPVPESWNTAIAAAVSDGMRLGVLTWQLRPEQGADELLRYTVHCFNLDSGRLMWRTLFDSAGRGVDAGAELFSSSRLGGAQAALTHLCWFDRFLACCAGDQEDVILLMGDTGKPFSRIPRIWEWQRGFLGPSSWQHIMVPGAASADPTSSRSEEELEEEGPHEYHASIVAGPIVAHGDDPRQEAAIFIAVAVGPNDPFWREVAECRVYEIQAGSFSDSTTALASLPRMIWGHEFLMYDGDIIWPCYGNGFVRVGPSRQEHDRGEGQHADCITRIEWYRQFREPQPSGTWSFHRPTRAAAFDASHGYLVPGRGYIDPNRQSIICFPLLVIDPDQGTAESMRFCLPFEGRLPELSKEWRSMASIRSNALALTAVEASEHILSLTVATAEDSWKIHFKTKDLLDASRRAQNNQNHADPR